MPSLRIPCLLLIVCASLLAGCATMSSERSPNADLSRLRSFYVVKLPKDDRGINQVIADQLAVMGYDATTGAESAPPAPVDAIVTYQDKWMWDITMYLIELNVQVRNPASRMVLATGRSYRPSLQRRSPPEMAREVLQTILQPSTAP